METILSECLRFLYSDYKKIIIECKYDTYHITKNNEDYIFMDSIIILPELTVIEILEIMVNISTYDYLSIFSLTE